MHFGGLATALAAEDNHRSLRKGRIILVNSSFQPHMKEMKSVAIERILVAAFSAGWPTSKSGVRQAHIWR